MLPLFGLLAGYAHAATVQVDRDSGNKGPPGPPYVRYFADSSEVNDLTVTYADGRFTLAESTALLKAGPGCTQNGPSGAVCEATGLRVYTRDLDDRIRAPGVIKHPVVLDGGVGDDAIEGGGWLAGGGGNDELRGGPGPDTISMGSGLDRGFGGGGNDFFGNHHLEPADTRAERDEMDGGPGADTVSYTGREGRAEIDLVRGIGGEPGENDSLVDLEGGFGNGRLIGDARDNSLTASLPSLLIGAAGDDFLSAGSKSRDRIDAGSGDDIVQLATSWSQSRQLPQRDQLRCGPGADAVRSPAPNELVPVDCEWADFVHSEVGPRVRLPQRSPSARKPLAVVSSGECPSGSEGERKRCAVRAVVHRVVRAEARELPELREPLATASGTFVRGGPRRLRLMPNALARRLIARGRCELASLTVIGLGYRRDQRVLFPYGRRCRPPAPIAP